MILKSSLLFKILTAYYLLFITLTASGYTISGRNWEILSTDDTLGVYVSGKRAGTMLNVIEVDKEKNRISVQNKIEINYAGMLSGSSDMKQVYVYNFQGSLVEAAQSLESINGISRWNLFKGDGNGWKLEITAGGEKNIKEIEDVKDNLRNEYDIQSCLLKGSIEAGSIWNDTVFDLTMGKNKEVETECVEIIRDERGRAVRWVFENRDKAANLSEKMVLDKKGRPVEIEVLPIFKARREAPGYVKNEEPVDFSEAFKIGMKREPAEDEALKIKFKKNDMLHESVSHFYRKADDGYVLNSVKRDCQKQKALARKERLLLKPTVIMQSENAMIKTLADSLASGVNDRCAKIERMNDFVYRKIEKVNVASFSSALETLKAGKGDCGEHAVLLGALLRAAGIESGLVTGLVYIPLRKGCFYHEWVYVKENNGWLFSDPAFGRFPVSKGYIPLIIDNTGEETQSLAGMIGNISIEFVKKSKK